MWCWNQVSTLFSWTLVGPHIYHRNVSPELATMHKLPKEGGYLDAILIPSDGSFIFPLAG